MNNRETVLITGASSGIGYELAKVFASHKYNLILVSRNIEKLNKLGNELENKYNIKVYIIGQDLSETNAAEKVFDSVISMKLQVDILVNNAGIGEVGLFHETQSNKDNEMIQINIGALTQMTKLFSKEMVKRSKGKILNVASTGSFSPGPFIAVYYATKAYVLSFSEAINKELKPYNITVTALCPGAVRTNFSKEAGKKDSPSAMNAEAVAKAAYRGLKNNKKVVVPGLINKILIRLPKGLASEMIFRGQKMLALDKPDTTNIK